MSSYTTDSWYTRSVGIAQPNYKVDNETTNVMKHENRHEENDRGATLAQGL